MANIFNTTAIGDAMQPAASGSLLMKDQAEKKAVKEGTEQGKAEKQAGLENTKKVEEAKEAKQKAHGRFDYSTKDPIDNSIYARSLFDNPYLSLDERSKAMADNQIANMLQAGVPEDEAKATVGLNWLKAKNDIEYGKKYEKLKNNELARQRRMGTNPIEAEKIAEAYATDKLKKEKDKNAIALGKKAYEPEIERLKDLKKQKESELETWEMENGWHGIFKAQNTPEMEKAHQDIINEIDELSEKIESYKDKPWSGEIPHTDVYWDYMAQNDVKGHKDAFDTWQLAESDLRKWEKDNQYNEATATPEQKAERAKLEEKARASENVYKSYEGSAKKSESRLKLKEVTKEANEWWDNLKTKENPTEEDIKKYDEYVSTINELAEASGNPNRLPTYWQKYADDYSDKNKTEKVSLEGGNLVGNTHEEVAKAKPGDFMKASNGEIIKLTQEDIDYSKKKVPQIAEEQVVREQIEENPEEKIDITKITDGVLKDKATEYNKMQTHIDELEKQLEDPNISVEERIKIQEDIKAYKSLRDGFINTLGTSTESIQSHAAEREEYEKFVSRAFQKNLVSAWIEDTKEFDKYINEAKERLETAKANHDSNGAKYALDQLNKLKEQKKAAHQEYGMYLMDALSTSLMNAGAFAMGSVPAAKSLYSQKIARNILAETDRWNAYKAKTLEQLGEDIDRRWDENSEVKKTYNELLRDAASADLARRLGVLDKVNGVEAIAAMKRVLGKDLKDTLSTMSLLGYGNEQILFQTLSASDIDINELVTTLEEFANQGLDFATNALQKLQGIRASFGE